MLNYLKNNEVHHHFQMQTAGKRLEWLDLVQLKEELQRPTTQYADEELETLLFGTPDRPVYSGFTLDRVKTYLEEVGLNWKIAPSESSVYRAVEIRSSGVIHRAPQLARRIKQLKWREFRRKQKAKLIETFCRLRERFASSLLNARPLKLNLGAGSEHYPGYIKVDWAGPQHVFDDIVTLKKVSNESVDEIYCNHVMEHVPPELIGPMLKRWREVLKPGGKLLLRMPDAKQAILHLHEAWREVSPEEVQKLGFPNLLAKESVFKGTVDEQLAIQFIYGWSDSMPNHWDQSNQHKSLWTPALGKKRLLEQGFEVERAENLGTLQTVLIA
ncbi:MAG: hypothetical protein H7333_10375, partial [Bdellovibrionales bacterium]|nr:hypothetical protein [Oligoflexia bacterium]